MQKEGRVNLDREGRAGDVGEVSPSELPFVLGFGRCGDSIGSVTVEEGSAVSFSLTSF